MFVEASEEQHAAFGDARSSTNAGRRGGGGGGVKAIRNIPLPVGLGRESR